MNAQPQRGCGTTPLPSAATPLGLTSIWRSIPRVARASQPWAWFQNPFGIRRHARRNLWVIERTRHRTPNARSGITLIELLVVLAIIGLLAALSLPAMKGIGQSNVLASATRQILDDLSLARALAIKDRTEVCVVFVPDRIWEASFPNNLTNITENLTDASFTTYAIFANGAAGDQPGRPNLRYLRLWKSLPDGTMISPNSFFGLSTNSFPYPKGDSPIEIPMPFIAFNQNGSLVGLGAGRKPTTPWHEEFLEIARGSIFAVRNAGGKVTDLDVQERPPGNGTNNIIRINGLTGRARLEQPQIQ